MMSLCASNIQNIFTKKEKAVLSKFSSYRREIVIFETPCKIQLHRGERLKVGTSKDIKKQVRETIL
jgi:hypothetical protein